MGYLEIIWIAIALSMDACSVGMTDGMQQPRMPIVKALAIGATFGVFQAIMPLIGYWTSSLVSGAIARIAPWVSFGLLLLLGGKMIADVIRERRRAQKTPEQAGDQPICKPLGAGKLLLQALATSIDALAIGVSLLAAHSNGTLVCSIWACAAIIGATTCLLSAPSVLIGKKIGDKLSGKAEWIGGLILIAIGVKIVVESYLG